MSGICAADIRRKDVASRVPGLPSASQPELSMTCVETSGCSGREPSARPCEPPTLTGAFGYTTGDGTSTQLVAAPVQGQSLRRRPRFQSLGLRERNVSPSRMAVGSGIVGSPVLRGLYSRSGGGWMLRPDGFAPKRCQAPARDF